VDQPDPAFAALRDRLGSADAAVRTAAINELLGRYAPVIQRYAVSAVLAGTDPAKSAQDVTSAVCTKLWRRLADGRIELTSEYAFLGFVRLMTERVAIDAARGRAFRPGSLDRGPDRPPLDPSADLPTPSVQLRDAERRVALDHFREEVRRRVGPLDWHLVEQRYFRGLEWKEMARDAWDGDAPPTPDQLDRLADKLRHRLAKVQDKLRRELALPDLFAD
jgi:hypothetical protein